MGCCLIVVSVGCTDDVGVTAAKSPVVATALPPMDANKSVQALLNEATQLLQSGDVAAAGKAIRAAVSMDPENPQLRFTLALVLGEEHRYPEAVMLLDELATSVPETRLPALGQTAQWMVLQGRWQQAEARYKEVLVEVPSAAMAHRQLSQLLIRQGRRLEASNHLNALCQQGNIDELELRALLNLAAPFAADTGRAELEPIGTLGKARFAIGTGNLGDATEILLSANTLTPSESALLGRIHAEQKDFAALETWVRNQSDSDTQTPDASFAQGVFAAHQGTHRLAVKYFCTAVLRDPTDAKAYEQLAQSLEHLDGKAEAAQATQRAQWLTRTRAIGNVMAASDQRDLNVIAELVQLLEQLHRPIEALSWQAVRVAYGKTVLPEAEQQAQLVEINRRRLHLLEDSQAAATEDFVLCGVDPESIALEVKSSE